MKASIGGFCSCLFFRSSALAEGGMEQPGNVSVEGMEWLKQPTLSVADGSRWTTVMQCVKAIRDPAATPPVVSGAITELVAVLATRRKGVARYEEQARRTQCN